MAACVPRTPTTVTRVLGGQHVQGAFVSPYAYEHYIRGEMASARGDFAQAASEFASARLGAEDDPFLAAREAASLEANGDHAQADRVLSEGLRLFPDSEALFLAQGHILSARGDRAGAEAAFAQAIAAAPQSSRGPLALSSLRLAQGAQESAKEPLVQYLARAPERGTDALQIRLRLALLRGDLDQALTLAEALGTLTAVERRQLTRLALEAHRPAVAARLATELPEASDGPLIVRALMAAGRTSDARAMLRSRPPEAFGDARTWAAFVLSLEDSRHAVADLEDALVVNDAVRPALVEAELRAGMQAQALEHLAPLLSAQVDAPTRSLLQQALRRSGLGALAAEIAR
jgi:Flp pilus assembly protein TadD